MQKTVPIPSALAPLAAACRAAGGALYLVGGAVRNALLGLPHTDFDITGPLTQQAVQAVCDQGGIPCVPMSTALGTLHIRLSDGEVYEYTPFRAERYAAGGAHRPESVRFGVSMTEDAKRRDFTVNALYADCGTGAISDPLSALPDLETRTLRLAAPDTLRSDALRILRLVRFSAELGFTPDAAALAAARENAALLADIAPERRFSELRKILLADTKYGNTAEERFSDGVPPLPAGERQNVLDALLLLETIGAWESLIPALTAGRGMGQRPDFHRYTILEHAFHAAANAAPDETLRFAALLHDVGKPAALQTDGNYYRHDVYGAALAREALLALRAPNTLIHAVAAIVAGHMFDVQGTATDATLRLRFATWGREQTAYMIGIREADFRGCGIETTYIAERWRALFQRMLSENTPFSMRELAVTGSDVMAATGLSEGAAVGAIKNKLFRHAVKRPKDNERARLLRIAEGLAKDMGAAGRVSSEKTPQETQHATRNS